MYVSGAGRRWGAENQDFHEFSWNSMKIEKITENSWFYIKSWFLHFSAHPLQNLANPCKFQCPLRLRCVKSRNSSSFPWKSQILVIFMKWMWISWKLVISVLFAYLLRNIHNANEFQCFLGLRGSRICEFYDNSTILVILWKLPKMRWIPTKLVEFSLFGPPGGSEPIEYATFCMVWSRCPQNDRKPHFSWKSTHFSRIP